MDALLKEPVTAGDVIQLRPQLRDQFHNASAADAGEFLVHIEGPDGVHELELKTLKGLGLYEVTHEVTHKGAHSIHFLLNGVDISGSPVEFNVNPAAALGNKSKLYPPTEPPVTHVPCELLLEAIDRYGNRLESGGSRVDARGSGPGVSACTVTDNDDGTYIVSFTAAVVGETRVTVRLDNVEMAPLRVVFVAPAGDAEGGGGKGGGKRGGKGGAHQDKPTEGGPEAAPGAAPDVSTDGM